MKSIKAYQAKRTTKSVLLYILLAVGAAVSLFPFFWMAIGATNDTAAITSGSFQAGNQLAINWDKLTAVVSVLRIFWNSLFITVVTTVLSIFFCAMAGFGFEKYRFKAKEFIYSLFLLSMMIPFAAQMIPLFKMMNDFNLMDTSIAVILPSVALPFLIFFFRQSFKSFPTEMLEAARIDGAGEIRIFFQMVLPPMRSTLAAGAIYAFMKQWNNYLWPLIVLQSNEHKTLTLLLSSLASAYVVDYGPLMLAIVISTLPMILIFLTMQKQFVAGIVGSSK